MFTLFNTKTKKWIDGAGRSRSIDPNETWSLAICQRWKAEARYVNRPEIIIVRWKMTPIPVR